eukprot:524495-Pleurochrysis_carterae.AAC.6
MRFPELKEGTNIVKALQVYQSEHTQKQFWSENVLCADVIKMDGGHSEIRQPLNDKIRPDLQPARARGVAAHALCPVQRTAQRPRTTKRVHLLRSSEGDVLLPL